MDLFASTSDSVAGDALPPGWAWARLGELCTITGGITVDAKRTGSDLVEVPYLRVANVQRGRLDLRTVKTIRVPGSRLEQLRLQPGDVLLNEGGDRDKVGRGWVWEGQIEDCIFQNHVFRVRPRGPDVNPYFLSHYLNEAARAYFLAGAKQTTNLASISLSKVAATPVAVPPAAEQARIVAAVEALFTDLDEAEAALLRAREGLAEYRASLLHAACTGALTAAWRDANPTPAEDGPALLRRILEERRAAWERDELARLSARGRALRSDAWKLRYQDPVTPSLAGLPSLPVGWVWASIGQLFQVMVGATPSRPVAEYWNGDVHWVSSGEVAFCTITQTRERITTAGLAASSTRLHPPGTVLLAMIGEGRTRGQAAILGVPACNSQNSAAIRVSETPIPPRYVYAWLSLIYQQNRRASAGGNQPALNKERVQGIMIPLPPLAEMEAIANLLTGGLEPGAELGRTLAGNEEQSALLRQSVLHNAFTGRLVPQDPADEPVATLLQHLQRLPLPPTREDEPFEAQQPTEG